MPDSVIASNQSSNSPASRSRAAHWWFALLKIWMASQVASSPRSKARCRPPAIGDVGAEEVAGHALRHSSREA